MAVLVKGAIDNALAALFQQLNQTGVSVFVVTANCQEMGPFVRGTLVAQPGERLWECIPPCSLVVCTEPDQEADVQRYTGFPSLTIDRRPEAMASVFEAIRSRLLSQPRHHGPRLTVCMITRDEERNIEQALRSVCGLASEVIVVDTGSTDGTMEIAARYGARVFSFAWVDDFAAARNESISHATGDWILALDADEALSPAFRQRVLEVLRRSTEAEAISTPITNFISGKPGDRTSVIRLFRNKPEYRFEGRVHEQVFPSVLRAGGKIESISLPLFHYGYTESESVRKGRRQRNRRLLEEGLREDPSRVDYWHHLGHEAFIMQDLAQAEKWLRKVLLEAPSSPFVAFSAPILANTLIQLRSFGDAWDAAMVGIATSRGRGKSLSALADLSLREGDFVTAEWCSQELTSLSPEAEGAAQSGWEAAQLHAQALLEQGRTGEAVQAASEVFRAQPEDMALAFWYIRLLERAEGVRAASVEAIGRFPTVAVKAAAIQPLIHTGDWELVCSLAKATCQAFSSPYHVVAFLRLGLLPSAVEMAGRLGVGGLMPIILWGLERCDTDALAAGLAGDIPASHRLVTHHVQSGTTIPKSLEWVLFQWMALAAELHMDELFYRLSGFISGDRALQSAKAASILHEMGRKQDALTHALQAPSEPDSLQVMGLTAFENGDWEAAAAFLQARANSGDAPVRVYWWGSLALRYLGKLREAEALIKEGRVWRPHSRLLADPPAKVWGALS